MAATTHTRIGMVNFINTAPLYEVWKRTVHHPAWRVIEAPPSDLNRLLFQSELDLGMVSSHEYALHPDRYRILADLSISASGPVGSVFLFSDVRVESLAGRLVLLSNQSQTSVHLVKIVLEEFYGIAPRYASGNVLHPEKLSEPPGAVLAIGDDALRLSRDGRYPVRLDLGEVWRQHTGLPFVFALWVVREAFCEAYPQEVAAIHRELKRCVAEGRRDLTAISAAVAPRIPMEPAVCYEYLQALEYDLQPEKQTALRLFFDYLIKRGEADSNALPLKIWG
ncbi:MAG: hypothetical protein A2521_11700 [Deltaproteobacteria bacterium RIFOXYD12_FULL_57_12]|nr:MAG: hypothetical protein A2521_11700 [Deltaproteobacteria bacterium RIFOXYD12_FULL_57_12]